MRKTNRAFTLLETLVSAAIIGLLVGLSLPAIQSARESARRASCVNHLRQIGIAVQSYESVHTSLPIACGMPNYARVELVAPIMVMKQYSIFTQLLPFIEQKPLYDAINFEAGLSDPCAGATPDRAVNETAFGCKMQWLFCPSDSGEKEGANYRVNLGGERWATPVDSPSNGPIMCYQSARLSATADGLSQTVAFSEKLRGSRTNSVLDPRIGMYLGGLGLPQSADECYASCKTSRRPPLISPVGVASYWELGTLPQTCYNHIIEPNSTVPDCYLPPSNPISGLFGARSDHWGGVHASMADGSVRFVTNSVARSIWKAMGTRGGGEL